MFSLRLNCERPEARRHLVFGADFEGLGPFALSRDVALALLVTILLPLNDRFFGPLLLCFAAHAVRDGRLLLAGEQARLGRRSEERNDL